MSSVRALHKRNVAAILIAVIVLGTAGLGFALTKLPIQAAAPNMPDNSTASTPSPTDLNSTPTNPPMPPSTNPTQTPTPTPPPPSQATPTNGNFELTISVEKATYSVGEPVNITLTITNISDQTVNFTSSGMNFDFIVTDGNGNLVYQWSAGRMFPMVVAILQFERGQNLTETLVWPQTYSSSNPPTVATPVAPGTYYIVGESNPLYGLQTAPVQITIVKS